MDKQFSFRLDREDKNRFGTARAGVITTPNGTIQTPAFMPVGTAATVKGMYPQQVRDLGAQIVLGNTYHLMLRPGAEQVAESGGLHTFMNWHHPILTDSGGFQVMSLSQLRKLDEDGVTFKSHIDGTSQRLTPKRSIEIQALLGADIQMQFDECIHLPADKSEIERAMQLSLRWGERSKMAFEDLGQGQVHGRALFGIVQGGDRPDLRQKSAEALTHVGFDGYAIGGLAVGEPQEVMLKMLEETIPALPVHQPHYLMGVGKPDDILKAVARGVDMFDCVHPTRAGRHGQAYTRFGVMNLKNARFKNDSRPIDEGADCTHASLYQRAYIHHLLRANEMLGAMILTFVNLRYYQVLMRDMREAIKLGRFDQFYQTTLQHWQNRE